MSQSSDVELAFAKIPILQSLEQAERAALCPTLELREYRANQFIMREGSDEHSILFIVEGQLKVCRADAKGKEVIIALLGPGTIVGEIALLTGLPRSADVVALLPCTVLALSSKSFFEHVSRFHGLALNMLREMAARVHLSSQRIMDLALYDVCCRVARILLSLSTQSEWDGRMVSLVNPRPTHQALASMAGTSREVVSRALKSLEEEGHIRVDEDTLVVKSVP